MKKIVALLLCVITIGSVFYGCKKESTTNDKNESTQIKYSYDAMFSNENESVKNNYSDICNAIINREPSYRINTDLLMGVNKLLYTSFPLVDLIDRLSPLADKSGFNIEYKYNENEHKQIVDAFNDKINSITKECKLGEVSNSEYAINVYNYIAKNIVVSDNTAIRLAESIIKGEGSSFTYSKLYVFLLQQASIDAYQVVADDNKNVACSFVLVKLNDSYYYCDPYREFNENAGQLLKYFGMTSDYVNELGYSKLTHPNYDEFELIADDNKFEKCQSAVSYTIGNGTLELTDSNSEVYKIVL